MAENYSTKTAKTRHLTALFNSREGADSAYAWLLKNGYTSDDIHLLMSEETKQKYNPQEAPAKQATTDEDAVDGLKSGITFGGGLGAALGAIAGIGAIAIPGLGIAIAGPLAASLAAAGGLLGGVFGALFGSSLPEQEAKELERAIREGSTLISVHPQDDVSAALIENEWRKRGGEIVNY
jgi:hypothetical protein